MTALVTINQGTAPAGSDGDTVRSAFSKVNANVVVLQTQAALTSATGITTAQALTTAHIGKRVNIALATAGVINLPAASTCSADSVIHLRNTGTTLVTLAITTGSGDTVALSKLNPGESALLDTDGVHAWNVLLRGRTNSDNEVVNGNCTVNGNETVGGTLGVTGTATFAGEVQSTSSNSYRTVSGNYGTFIRNDGTNCYLMQTSSGSQYGTFNAYRPFSWNLSTGVVSIDAAANGCAIGSRPTFAGKVPWDTGNLANPATLDTSQTVSGAKTFTSFVTASFAPGGSVGQCNYNLNGLAGLANIGFASNNAAASIILRCSAASALEVINGASNGYNPITCSSLTQTSDRDLKTDVVPLVGVLDKIRTLRTVRYTLKSDRTKHLGVIAQEWQGAFPELVVETGADIDADGDFIAHQYDEKGNEIFGPNGKPESRKALGFNYTNASAVALQGLIELQEKLDAALLRIAELEAKCQ